MKTKLYLIASLVITTVILLFLFLVVLSSKFVVTPLEIVSTNPTDTAQDIDVNSSITVTFNKPPKTEDVQISLNPQVEGNIEVLESSLIFKPKIPLSESETYTATIGLLDRKPSKVIQFSFQTVRVDRPQDASPRDPNLVNETRKFRLEKHPDIYLSNYTPFSNNNFSITSAYTKEPSGHFYFTVVLKDNRSKSRDAFIIWLKSLSLTDDQITNLDIRYK